MNVRTRLTALGLATATALTFSAVSATAASASPVAQTAVLSSPAAASALSTPISGTFQDALGGVGTVTGTFTPTRFSSQNGVLMMTGTVVATLTDSAGTVLGTTSTTTTQAVTAQATCQVLNLDLGALHLNLLGLVVDLAPVHLAITAEQGPGNLLGNLLCAVTHLLDGSGSTTGLAGLLNQILGLLGG